MLPSSCEQGHDIKAYILDHVSVVDPDEYENVEVIFEDGTTEILSLYNARFITIPSSVTKYDFSFDSNPNLETITYLGTSCEFLNLVDRHTRLIYVDFDVICSDCILTKDVLRKFGSKFIN